MFKATVKAWDYKGELMIDVPVRTRSRYSSETIIRAIERQAGNLGAIDTHVHRNYNK